MKSIIPNIDLGLPTRITPEWEEVATVSVSNKETLIKVMKGNLPIGKLPFEIIVERERKEIVVGLKGLQLSPFKNTNEKEPVYAKGGIPFVDSATVAEYLATKPDPLFEQLTQPLLDRYINFFKLHDFKVMPLTDSVTGLPYHSKVCRQINVSSECFKDDGNQCTVLHCDDIIRDGSMKPDFHIPNGLQGQEYYQISMITQLEDGGYTPDALIVYEVMYSSEMEAFFDTWRASQDSIRDKRFHSYVPELRKTYMFSTLNLHDVRGGHPLAERLNFAVFFVYVPATNTIYYYN